MDITVSRRNRVLRKRGAFIVEDSHTVDVDIIAVCQS